MASTHPVGLYIFLQVAGGQVGLPLFVLTMLASSKVKRHYTLINFCWTWIVYSVVYCLTAYNGQRNIEGEGRKLCVAQAVLTHGVVALCSTAAWSLHVQIFLDLYSATHGPSWITLHRRKLMTIVLATPYFAFLAFTIWSAVVTARHPEVVTYGLVYYCSIDYQPIIHAIPAYAAAMGCFVLILQFLVFRSLFLRWKVLQENKIINHRKLSLIIRTAILTVATLTYTGAGLSFSAGADTTSAYLAQASAPTLIYLMFGLRGDVMEAWRIWPRFRCVGFRRRGHSGKAAGLGGSAVQGSTAHGARLPLRVILVTGLASTTSLQTNDGSCGTDAEEHDKDLELGLDPPEHFSRLESHGYRVSFEQRTGSIGSHAIV